MLLNAKSLNDGDKWKAAGFEIPEFDRDAVAAETHDNPIWIHFGAGNIFRAFQSMAVQNLLSRGVIKSGLVVCEGYDYEIITKMNRPHDDLSILATLKSDGTVDKTVVGAVTESYPLDVAQKESFERLQEIFSAGSLQMASFTITEKGYLTIDGKGEIPADIKNDYEKGPQEPVSYMGKVTALLYSRFLNGALPIAMVSMDNCSHNGDKLFAAVNSFATKWEDAGLCQKGFKEYVQDGLRVSFPWTMIDKITPRPDASVKEMLEAAGAQEMDAIVTSKNTYIAPFVNSEECEYLVIEDDFPAGRPPLEKAGFMFTTRDTVDMVEKMKVCTCLNPLHTSLAIFGCLLGFDKISEEMKDADLHNMVEIIGYREGLPVVTDPGIIDPRDFIDTVINVRIPNPFMPDTPQRIATDTSQKLSIRFGETIKRYLADDNLDVSDLKLIPLVFAGWLRYLMAIDDEGNPFERSSDPRLSELSEKIRDIEFTVNDNVADILRPILSDETIFGTDLVKAGLDKKVIDYFMELNAQKGAVRKTLKKYCS